MFINISVRSDCLFLAVSICTVEPAGHSLIFSFQKFLTAFACGILRNENKNCLFFRSSAATFLFRIRQAFVPHFIRYSKNENSFSGTQLESMVEKCKVLKREPFSRIDLVSLRKFITA